MIIVINSGSTSIKYKLFDDFEPIGRGIVDNIGHDAGFVEHHIGGETVRNNRAFADHREGIEAVAEHIQSIDMPGTEHTQDIEAIGHRVVHGGHMAKPQRITPSVKETIEEYVPIAPLHNPHNLAGIEAMEELFPNVPQVAVFDTAFHQTMPEEAYLYGLPLEYYEDFDIRRYGFHGISHAYVANEGARLLDLDVDHAKLITCHLGGGCSLAAVEGGTSVETSMGFSPLEGIIMATRTGDIDPMVVKYLHDYHDMELARIFEVLNNESGLTGLSAISGDMRELTKAKAAGDERASLAIRTFCYRIKRRIGAYAAVLGEVDGIIFTAGIGEHAPLIRAKAGELELLDIVIDEEKNRQTIGEAGIISTQSSKTPVAVVPTDEELRIARQTARVLS